MKYYFYKRFVGNVSLFVYCKGGERCEITTGVKHDSELHKTQGYLGRTKSARFTNKTMFALVKRAEDLIYEFKKANEGDYPRWDELKSLLKSSDQTVPTLRIVLEKYRDSMSAGLISKSNGLKMSEWTKVGARSTVNTLTSRLSAPLLDTKLGKSNLGTTKKARKFGHSIINELINLEYQDKSISTYLRHVRDCLSWYDIENNADISNFRSGINIKVSKKDVSILTKEESDYIINNFDQIKNNCTCQNEKNVMDIWLTALLLMPVGSSGSNS